MTLSSEIVLYEHAQWSEAINALMIIASLSDSPCSARQRGKGVSERSELAPCIIISIIQYIDSHRVITNITFVCESDLIGPYKIHAEGQAPISTIES